MQHRICSQGAGAKVIFKPHLCFPNPGLLQVLKGPSAELREPWGLPQHLAASLDYFMGYCTVQNPHSAAATSLVPSSCPTPDTLPTPGLARAISHPEALSPIVPVLDTGLSEPFLLLWPYSSHPSTPLDKGAGEQ